MAKKGSATEAPVRAAAEVKPGAKRAAKPAAATETPGRARRVEQESGSSHAVQAASAAVSVAVKAAPKPALIPKTNGAADARADVGPAAKANGKIRKTKLVRDSFTMPELEYEALGAVKKACVKAGFEVKKSELLRVGLGLIRKMDIAELKQALAVLPPLKAERPGTEK
ncbi:MAG: hypothetical protein JWQ23_1402 [Herminiimonas sp.]|nr:hypothetical protein [Herminiimonas sp.]